MKAKCPRKQKGEYFTRNPEESDKNAPKPLRAAEVKTWVEERSHLMKTKSQASFIFRSFRFTAVTFSRTEFSVDSYIALCLCSIKTLL